MKKNKEKEKNTNPYHKEYGVFSNSIHALKSMLSYSHRFIPFIIISVVCAPIMQYLWSFISKFVIDMITTGQSITALALLMGGFTVIQITATMLNFYGNSFFHIYIGARFRQMGLKNRKIMSVDYGYLEDKDFMDCLNPNSLEVLTDCKIEAGLAAAADRYAESHEGGKTAPGFQFMRLGYFCLDSKDTQVGHPVFNRSVSLKESFKK